MTKEFYQWSGIAVLLIVLVAFLVIDSRKELAMIQKCQDLRIKALTEKFFSWDGIVELNQKGEYQPKCL